MPDIHAQFHGESLGERIVRDFEVLLGACMSRFGPSASTCPAIASIQAKPEVFDGAAPAQLENDTHRSKPSPKCSTAQRLHSWKTIRTHCSPACRSNRGGGPPLHLRRTRENKCGPLCRGRGTRYDAA
ncbi:hypothetical protein QO239_08405 [Cupriavidus taiwanensis]|uniref:hypothetical protein n=1 Tax=Cupriavidus taiwanensis TaxID=164546 RepID=UPI00253FD0EE|nr:hypothetical protein [Cupriavidus taiwanensis]MDK3022627.1 hypothetical protein [Cupriavidus taiwanensis]